MIETLTFATRTKNRAAKKEREAEKRRKIAR
jgi:hypothetical protein